LLNPTLTEEEAFNLIIPIMYLFYAAFLSTGLYMPF